MKYAFIFFLFYSILISILCFVLINNTVSSDQKIWLPLWGSVLTASATFFVALGAQRIAANQRDANIKNSIREVSFSTAKNIEEKFQEMIVAEKYYRKGLEYPSQYIELIHKHIESCKVLFGKKYMKYCASLLMVHTKPMSWNEISSGSLLLYFINKETELEKISEMEENRQDIFKCVFDQYKYCQLHLNCKVNDNWKKVEEKFL
ncbi:hypothetical protein NKW55_07710 [Gluconobacter kondonii]|uniref:hypothetical protein n=1 Tax=Gluconobacter kondonii TaxID=941463 RepID=UPI00209EBACC|nr:hypothetical protein [Gluconobacter kondonii]MCP1236493.1 hypothetical protein [Gluconobacter kondonii]